MASIKDSNTQALGLRVLVIEDSSDTLDMLKLWLSTFGCEVLIASDAMEGLKLATSARPDLIISDIGMPEVDGYDLMRMVRTIKGLETVPAIALTGYDRVEDKNMSVAAGYNAHLSKPTDMRRLISLIKELTKK